LNICACSDYVFRGPISEKEKESVSKSTCLVNKWTRGTRRAVLEFDVLKYRLRQSRRLGGDDETAMAVAIGVSPAPASASASEWPSAAEAAVTTVVPEEEEEEGDRAGEGRGDAEPALAADVVEVTRTTCASACGGSEG
jgi:hypothetical protein